MAIETTNVTVRVNDQTGNPVSGAIVSAKLMTTEKNTGFVLPKEVTGETNDSGVVVLAVFPNELGTEGSEYQFRIEDPRTGKVVKIFAVVPNADCELHSIAELDRYELRGAGEVVSSAVATNAAIATAAANTATTKAAEAAASATAASANIPNSVSGGLGEFKPYTGTLAAAAVLPTGVKWAYFLIAIQTGAVVAGVANGGTTVGAATAGVTWNGFMWRVL